MPDQPILDPKRELPTPHDMLLPMTHWQRVKKPAFWHRYLWILISLLLILVSLWSITIILNNLSNDPDGQQKSLPPLITPTSTHQEPTIIQTPFSISPTSPAVKDALLTITARGGLCSDGSCTSVTLFERDGTLTREGVKKGRLTEMELIHLNSLMNSADFTQIRANKFTGTCPIAYDGSELIYEFYKEVVVEKVASCETAIDENHVLFKTINQLLEKYK